MITNEFSKIGTEVTSSQEGGETRPTNRQPSALVKASPVRHPGAASRSVTHSVAAVPAVAQSEGSTTESTPLLHFFLATFNVKRAGKVISEIVEVPHTSNGVRDTQSAWKVIRARYPDVRTEDIRRTASRIVSRPGGKLPVIEIRDGETIRQLFPDKSEYETGRQVGMVMFDGAHCDVILRHLRSKSAVSVTLRQPGGVVVNFSAQHTTMQLVAELPKIIAEDLDGQGTDLELFFKKI